MNQLLCFGTNGVSGKKRNQKIQTVLFLASAYFSHKLDIIVPNMLVRIWLCMIAKTETNNFIFFKK